MKLFAFWTFDHFPYVLGAEVVKYENGCVTVRGYGEHQFTPLYVCDLEKGEQILDQLKNATATREQMISEAHDSAIQNLRAIVPWSVI